MAAPSCLTPRQHHVWPFRSPQVPAVEEHADLPAPVPIEPRVDPAPSTAGFNSELATVLSPSQVLAWLACQAAWYFKYFLNLLDTTDSKRAFGSAVDAALSGNFEQKRRTRIDLPREEVLALFRAAWAEQLKTAVLEPDEDPAELERQGEVLVQKYLCEVAGPILPVVVQQKVSGSIAGVGVQGKLDLLDTNGVITDFKVVGAKASKVRAAHILQLATYTQITPGASRTIQIHNLVRTKKPQIQVQPYIVTPADVKFLERIYPLAQEGIRAGIYIPNRGSMFCSRKSCAYWRECEKEFGGTVPEGAKCDG